MNSAMVIIYTAYVINLLVIKTQRNHHALIFFPTNSPRSFQNTQTIETALCDSHKLAVKISKMHPRNNQPKVITYRDYKKTDNSPLSEELLFEIKKPGPLNKKISIFHNVCVEVPEKYIPEKQQKYIRANQTNFIDSELNPIKLNYVAFKVM